MSYGWNGEFNPGDKVRFFGMKARVDEFNQLSQAWQVPILVLQDNKEYLLTIAHCDHLVRRGKKAKMQEVEVDLPEELREFFLDELCRRDIKPSKLLKEIVMKYLDEGESAKTKEQF